jgi:hypothetical protein
MWQLLCASSGIGEITYHPYIGFKKKDANNNAAIKLLSEVHPNMKMKEIEHLAELSTKKELKTLAEERDIATKL